MSGGHFDYKQYHVQDIADSIEDYLKGYDLDECDVNNYINGKSIHQKTSSYSTKSVRVF